MTNLPVAITEALHNKSLASRFSGGRFDKDMKWSAERQFAEQALQKNPKLVRCTESSIMSAMLDVAYTGLSLSPALAHGYLVPYGDICTFAPGYRGLLHLAYKAGTIKSVQANLAYDNDDVFQVWTDETGRHLKHIENVRGNRGEISHAYCLAFPTAGGPALIEIMTAAELRAVEAQAKRKGGGAVWGSAWRGEMCKKAVIRRASKTWPKDSGGLIEHMMGVNDQFSGFDDVIVDADPPEQEICISLDQQTALNDLLLEVGIPADQAPEWLGRYAKAKGYGSIENMPERLYDEAHAELDDRARRAIRGSK